MAKSASGTTRRSGAQVRAALIDAASAEFARWGYAGAKMRTIARRAKTSETGLARHFASKEELFIAAIVEPFVAFMDSFAVEFGRVLESATDVQAAFAYPTELLYEQIVAHQNSVLALLAASRDPNAHSAIAAASFTMGDWISQMYDLSAEFYERFGEFDVPQSRLWPGFFAAMIVGVAVFEPLFVPADDRPSRAETLDTISGIWTRAITGSVSVSSPSKPGSERDPAITEV